MESLQRAITILGGQVHLAEALGVVQSAISGWLKRGKVPVKYCAAIERVTLGQVTRRDLCPDDWQDIWPELAAPQPNTAPAPAQQAPAAINSEAKEAVHG